MDAKQRIYTAEVLYYTVLKIRTDFQKGRQEDVMERNDPRYQAYVEILKEELIPAMGCTEPIALAYGAAIAYRTLGAEPERITAAVSGSIIKNVKSVVVPKTGGMKGIETAIAAGVVAGNPDLELEVLSGAPENTGALAKKFLEKCPVTVCLADSDRIFDIQITMYAGKHSAFVRIVDTHTNVVSVRRDETVLKEREIPRLAGQAEKTAMLEITKIVEYARTCRLEDVAETIEYQISCNQNLSQEGLRGSWGAEIGRTLLSGEKKPDVKLRAMAAAAAGSDARMSGCELPAVINSGSGNQGLTITLPILEYAKELNASHEQLIRALVLANLVAVRIKQSIGYLSAYCGAVSAGCAAGCGIAYLQGADCKAIAHTLVNSLAIVSGIICDGAKPSCAAKIASSVQAGILGYHMYLNGQQFRSGDGIVTKGVEATIRNVGRLGRDGMRETDKEIVKIMLHG